MTAAGERQRRRFVPAGPLRGGYVPPADKSISHRAAIVGAMADEPVVVRNFLAAADTHATLDALRSLGAGIDGDERELVIRGVGLCGAFETTGGRIDVQNAGTLLRLLPGWLAGQPGGIWVLQGDASIARRPVDRIVDPLRSMGAEIESRDGRPPLIVRGGAALRGVRHRLPVASAQVKSCLLLAGLLAEGETVVTEPHVSRDHTERMLSGARVPIAREGPTTRVTRVDELELERIEVPGDPSSAAFLVAAAAIVPGSRIVVRRVGLNWTRTGFLRIAQRMGAVVLGELEPPPAAADATAGADEPVGELDVAAAPLVGTTVEADEVPLAIDELPLVALLGCFAEGETVVRGAGELRVKESDRIAGVVEGLRALGADIEMTADGFAVRGAGAAVRGGGPLEGGTLDARGDHRLAMLGAVAGLCSERGVTVVGMEAAGVSYPGFEGDLRALLGR